MIKKQKVTFSLEEPLLKLLQEHSDITGCSVASLCRACIYDYLSMNITVYYGRCDEEISEEEEQRRLERIMDIRKRGSEFVGFSLKFGDGPGLHKQQLWSDEQWEENLKKGWPALNKKNDKG